MPRSNKKLTVTTPQRFNPHNRSEAYLPSMPKDESPGDFIMGGGGGGGGGGRGGAETNLYKDGYINEGV